MKTKPFTFLLALTFLFLFSGFYVVIAEAHRSGCHRWHSCPSDSGSYICGDIGYCSGCPDNQFCEGGQPVSRSLEPNKSNESFESYIIESFFTFLSMNLAYFLRGELITLLNKRLITHDQLNLEVAVGIS